METAYDVLEEMKDYENRIVALEKFLEICEGYGFSHQNKMRYKTALINTLEDTKEQLKNSENKLKAIKLNP